MSTKLLMTLRVLGNVTNVLGYFVLLYVDPLAGSIIRILGLIFATPFCVKIKLWDVVALFAFFGALDVANVIRILFF